MRRRKMLVLPIDPDSPTPLYQQIARAIARGIRKGRLVPGEALPGTRALAESLNVTRNTALAAYRELEAEGWVVSVPDHGTRVAPELPVNLQDLESGSFLPVRPAQPEVRREPVGFALPDAPAFLPPPPLGKGSLALVPGLPDVRLLDVGALVSAHSRVLRLQRQSVLGSGGDPQGHPPLRASLSELLREVRGLCSGPERLLLTGGLMPSLDLLARTLVAPGDAVLVENPGHYRVVEAMRWAGARVLPVPVDAEGIRVDQVESILERQRVRAICISTSPQCPTQAVLSLARRRRLLSLAVEHGVAILELDLGLGFHDEEVPSLPLASEDRWGVVVHVTSLDQLLAPGLRMGLISGPEPLVQRLTAYRQALEGPGQLAQEGLVEELFRDGEVQRHLRRVRKAYAARRARLLELIPARLGDALRPRAGQEGLFLWADARPGLDLEAWTRACAERGVVFHPGRHYEAEGRPLQAVALGFAACDEAELEDAVGRMAAALPRP